MAAKLITLISLAAGALGDSCVGLGCLTRGEHFWRGTDADGQPLLLNLVFGSDKLSASGTLTSGTLTSGTNTSEPFEATVSEETAELLITWSVGVQEWSGIVVAMDPGSLLLHGSEGTIDLPERRHKRETTNGCMCMGRAGWDLWACGRIGGGGLV